VTRPSDEADGAAADLEALGAEVLVAPTVEILPPADFAPIDRAIAAIATFDWLVFTSGNGVRFFLERLESTGRDLRALGSLKLAAIGPATATALGRFHLRADLVPETYRSEDLAAALAPRVAGRRVLLARADRGRTLLLDVLRFVAHVEQIAVYCNADAGAIPALVIDRLVAGSVDWITLTSSAIAERLHALLPDEARRRIGREVRLASLSPVTTATAARLGWPVGAEASVATWPGLVRALVDRVTADRTMTENETPTSPTTPPIEP
jgi:uroporphyrinogen III methyltransferase/synthase